MFVLFKSCSSGRHRGPRMLARHHLTLKPQIGVAPLPPMLTMAPNPPPASQDGPRREEPVGEARERQPITRYGAETEAMCERGGVRRHRGDEIFLLVSGCVSVENWWSSANRVCLYRGAGLDWVAPGSSPPPHLGRSLDKAPTAFIGR